jgi:hypothetical protein
MAITPFVVAIVNLILIFLTYGFIISSFALFFWFGLLALSIIIGIVGLIRIRKNNKLKGKLLVWLGIIFIIIEILFLLRVYFVTI